jgi:hypothetical protein
VPNIVLVMLKVVELPSGCWVWTGCTDDDGYGKVQVDGRDLKVHRYLYEEIVGEIPEGFEIDHVCCTRTCVKPLHLTAMTHADNWQACWDRGRAACRNGHPWSLFEKFHPDGARYCGECRRVRRLEKKLVDA